MEYNLKDKLCGATFFVALLEAARPQLSSKDKWQGNSNGITQPKMFAALVKIANPNITSDFNSDSYEKTFAKYKRCHTKSSRTYFPLEGMITNALLERIFKYPSLIANPNVSHLTAEESQKAAVCKVHDYEVVTGGIKFKYVISKEFMQQPLNEAPTAFGILACDQTNELDHCHWEIKHINLLKLLQLGG